MTRPGNPGEIRIQPLTIYHRRGAFCCSNEKIQNYCRNNVRKQNDMYMVRAFVACRGESSDVLGFYYLCLSSYELGEMDEAADEKFHRVAALPAIYLVMIGVHQDYARAGIGKLLMRDAFVRTLVIAENAGTYALALDALDERLVTYYRDNFGFQRFKDGGLEMFLPLRTIQQAVTGD